MLREELLSQREVNDRFAALMFDEPGYDDAASYLRADLEQLNTLPDSPTIDTGKLLQEKYDLPYNPETVVYGVGSVGVNEAMDQDKYKPFVADATSIVVRYIHGDTSAIGRLSADFAALFEVRLASYDGTIPRDEIDGIISTVCIDLARQAKGEDFDSPNA